MKERSHTKTQRVKLTWNDPLNPSSIKKFQVDNDREYMGQSNMSKENIINLKTQRVKLT